VNSQGFRQIRKHRNNTSLLISDPGNSALHVLRISPTSCAHRRRDSGIHHRRAGAPHRPEPDRVLATVMFAYFVNSIERAAKMGDQRWGRTARKTRSWIRIGSKPQHWKERAGSSRQRSSESPIQPVWSVRFWARSASRPYDHGSAHRQEKRARVREGRPHDDCENLGGAPLRVPWELRNC
jgi:hypothetical protein